MTKSKRGQFALTFKQEACAACQVGPMPGCRPRKISAGNTGVLRRRANHAPMHASFLATPATVPAPTHTLGESAHIAPPWLSSSTPASRPSSRSVQTREFAPSNRWARINGRSGLLHISGISPVFMLIRTSDTSFWSDSCPFPLPSSMKG